MLCHSAFVAGLAAAAKPEQVHLAVGLDPTTQATVQWSTLPHAPSQPMIADDAESYVTLSLSPRLRRPTVVEGSSFLFNAEWSQSMQRTECYKEFLDPKTGCVSRTYTMHVAHLGGLRPRTRYYYKVGGPRSGWSEATFSFVTQPAPAAAQPIFPPLTYAVYGDFGDYNGRARPMMVAEAKKRRLDMVLHVGDFAYDFNSDDGRNGDQFMRDMEELGANVPWMTTPGNHEVSLNFNHYTNRFRNMPANSGSKLEFPQIYGTVANNWWYSFRTGYVYVIFLFSEFYGYLNADAGMREWARAKRAEQHAWFQKELARANAMRDRHPWLLVGTHHPMYCTRDTPWDGCGDLALNMRDGYQESPSGQREHGLEKLVHEAGVDLFVAGHVHNYERMYDIAPWPNTETPCLAGKTTRSTHNPPACTYVLTAAPGNVERLENFTSPAAPWDARRLRGYGWSRMTVHNATHLHWQQIQTDTGSPTRGVGEVADDFWLVQEKHGERPAADTWTSDRDPVGHRRVYYGSEEPTAETGREVQATEDAARGAEMQEARAAGRYECDRSGGTPLFQVACKDPRLTRDVNTRGSWQATRERSGGRTGELTEAGVFV